MDQDRRVAAGEDTCVGPPRSASLTGTPEREAGHARLRKYVVTQPPDHRRPSSAKRSPWSAPPQRRGPRGHRPDRRGRGGRDLHEERPSSRRKPWPSRRSG
ncbi:hypothetical protein QJS66_04360 [Kocuria rhizophila]|nr:hypothetical protein QJS66_04360 [Kocuria rhizophila]